MNPLFPENPYLVASAIGSTEPFIEVFKDRDPTPNDTNHTIQKRWFNTVTEIEWILTGFTSFGGLLQALWVPFSAGGALLKIGVPTPPNPSNTTITPDSNGLVNFTSNDGSVIITGTNGGLGNQSVNFATSGTTNAIQQITLDDGIVSPTGSPNNVTLTGETVNNATNAKPVFFNQTTSSTGRLEVQLATAVAPTPVDSNDAGLSCFNANQFTVDATSGMVSLLGGTSGAAILGITLDDTQTAVPTAGIIQFIGTTVAFGTHNRPLFTRRPSGSIMSADIQIATTVAPTPGVNTNCGIACFNNTDFTIDPTSGMVSLVGSGAIATLTGNGATIATASGGNINVLGTSNITTTGSGDTLSVAVSGTTNHAVQLGNSSGSLTSLTPSSNAYSVLRQRATNPSTTDPQWISESSSFNATFGNFNGTYVSQSGRYIRFGNMVFVQINMDWNSNSNFGDMYISNLPFLSGSALSRYPGWVTWGKVGTIVYPSMSTAPFTTSTQIAAVILGNSSARLDIVGLIPGQDPVNVLMTATGTIAISITYFAVSA